MVEDVEECVLCLRRVDPFLDVINDEHVDRLVERNEIIEMILNDSIGELHLEKTGADIQHALLGIEMLGVNTDGIDQMGLSTA